MKRFILGAMTSALLFGPSPCVARNGEVLGGVAQILGAAAPMAMSAAEASAAKAIAKENARATLRVTEIQSETTKELAATQAEVALVQSLLSADIQRMNQQKQTDDLAQILQTKLAIRQMDQEENREKREMERELLALQVLQAERAAAMEAQKAQATLQAQLVQAGLVTGFRYQDSSSGLSVSPLSASQTGMRGFAPLIAGSTPQRRFRSLTTYSGPSDLAQFRESLAQQSPAGRWWRGESFVRRMPAFAPALVRHQAITVAERERAVIPFQSAHSAEIKTRGMRR